MKIIFLILFAMLVAIQFANLAIYLQQVGYICCNY